ncbi:bifunctional 2-polyprenyl-6-hydroxyphenol methylase/3-demethylubiquinol 3-O-methyltransferase UbiG [Anaerovibrio lipolyticus]|uniref:class I SAM-dependent methyltransferase n=1 Tax=Anaerovibrio lipolyticus TaxID=82374 RepID=UPI0026EC1693|nr:class I SAM-dependent methyltransferase [Anaerovibrio lipolyticus]MBE6105752.1 class I SAM-dependent methyltransferase [Anaerovibrio lipolyticus]
MACPLCNAEKYIKLSEERVDNIVLRYKKMYKIDTSKFFTTEKLELRQCVDCRMEYYPYGQEGDADFYEAFSRRDGYYVQDKYEYKWLLRKICEINPQSILEIGCGEGYFLDHLKDSFEVRATEHNPAAIEILKSKGIELDEDGKTYDLICSFQVMEHVKEIGDFLNWLMGKLNPQGYFFCAVPNPDSTLIQEVFQPIDMPPHHMNHIHKETLYKLSELFSMEVIDYFAEPLRTNSGLQNVLKEREKVYAHGLWRGMLNKFARGVRMALFPVLLETIPLTGHSHGILLRKN